MLTFISSVKVPGFIWCYMVKLLLIYLHPLLCVGMNNHTKKSHAVIIKLNLV